MNESVKKKPAKRLDQQYKLLAKNTLFSIFVSYGSYIFTIINSFLLARMISREDWGIFILAISLIGIFSLIINFIPPGLMFAMNFYIPRYRAKNKPAKLRSFVLKAFYTRIIIITVMFLIALFFFVYFESIYNVFLKNHIAVLYILTPLIIISSLDAFFSTFLIGFNLFKINLVFFVVKSITKITPIIVFFFLFNTIDIEIIALINLLSLIIPVILEFFIFYSKIPKGAPKEEERLKFKKFIKKVIGYGGFLRFEGFLGSLWKETQTQAIGVFESSEWVIGNNISRNYTNSSSLFLSSLTNPLIYSLSSLDYKENYNKIINMFQTIFKYSLYVFLFISGVLFFLSDFFLAFIYGDNYVEYSLLIKIMLISMVISIYPMLFSLLLRTTNKIKLLATITAIFFPLTILFVLTGLINYGIYGMYFAIIILNIILLICEIIMTWKLLRINLDFFKMILQYCSYIIAIFVANLLDNLIFNDIRFLI